MDSVLRIWYVSAQRLCNFRCAYCVSVGSYAKSNSVEWSSDLELFRFNDIVESLARFPHRVGIRLATLGEPFASKAFLEKAAWLTSRENVEFVELLTNGSLLEKRMPLLAGTAETGKLSLWITHHQSEISVERFVENAVCAQEKYGCFVVVNGLLFPDNQASIAKLRDAAVDAGLRFNLDFGYDPLTPHGAHESVAKMIPILKDERGVVEQAVRLGGDRTVLELNVGAMKSTKGRRCAAGHRYMYVDMRGDAYRCSRYQALGMASIGNVLNEDFRIGICDQYAECEAGFGCGNKEDFLNLRIADGSAALSFPSLGCVGPGESAARVSREHGASGLGSS